VNARAIYGCNYVLHRAGGGRDQMNSHLKPRGHHAQRIVHAGLIVQNELLREEMQHLAIRWEGNGPRPLNCLLDFIAANLPRTRTQADAAVTVDAANVGPPDTDDGMLNRRTGFVLGGFNRLLNGGDCFVEFYDHAFARAPRFGHTVATIAQAAVGDLHHQCARLGASYIDSRENVSLLIRNSYQCSNELQKA